MKWKPFHWGGRGHGNVVYMVTYTINANSGEGREMDLKAIDKKLSTATKIKRKEN